MRSESIRGRMETGRGRERERRESVSLSVSLPSSLRLRLGFRLGNHLRFSLWRLEHVADAANGLNQLGFVLAVNFVAQVIDVNVNHVGQRVECLFPDLL